MASTACSCCWVLAEDWVRLLADPFCRNPHREIMAS